MFLPIGAAPNPKGTPFVTRALTAVNVAVFRSSTSLAARTAPTTSSRSSTGTGPWPRRSRTS